MRGGSETTIDPPAGGGALAQGSTPRRWNWHPDVGMESARPSTAGQATPSLAVTTARSPDPGESYLPAHPDSFARALGA